MKSVSVEIKVAILILISVVIAITAGFLAYKSLSFILTAIKKEAQPDLTLVVLKEINAGLTESEASMRYYSLTGEGRYLAPYYDLSMFIDNKIQQLYEFNKYDLKRTAQIDTIKFLLENKFKIWDNMLFDKRGDRVTDVLNKLVEKLVTATDSITMTIPTTVTPPGNDTAVVTGGILHDNNDVEKENFLSRLFKRKNRDEVPIDIQTRTTQQQLILIEPKDTTLNLGVHKSVIETEISLIKEEAGKAKMQNTVQEFRLIKMNEEVSRKLAALISRIEQEEMESITRRAEEAGNLVNATNRWMLLFFSISLLLLLGVFYVVQRYIRKSNAYQKALIRSKDEALKLTKTREQFVANISHEVRTPMNAIIGFADQLLQADFDVESNEQISIIKNSADHLLHIINEVLDFSKIDSGKLHLENISFNPRQTIEEAFLLYQKQAKDKGIRYELLCKGDLPAAYLGDPYRLKQILLNLISNAIKFTSEGDIIVKIWVDDKQNGISKLNIEVSDTGIGIEDKVIKKIFNEFEQADASTTRQFGGTGLGLSIVKKLIDLQKGSITVCNNNLGGATFKIEIPYKYGITGTGKEIEKEVEVTVTPELLTDCNILVADDDEYNCRLIAHILKKWRLPFKIVNDGEALVKEYFSGNYNFLLVDIRMPKISGLQAVEQIRGNAQKNKSKVPIIALTATIGKSELLDCQKLKINKVMLKPFREQVLFQGIAEVMGINLTKSKNLEPEVKPVEKHFQDLYRIADGDKSFVKEMLCKFIESTPRDILKMRQSLKNKDWLMVAECAHKMKSPCRHLDAKEVATLLKQIEDIARNGSNKDELKNLTITVEKELTLIIDKVKNHIKEYL